MDEQRSRRVNLGASLPWGLLMVLVLGGLSLWGATEWIDHRMRPRHIGLAEIASLTGLEFPSSTLLVHSRFEDFPRANLLAELHLDRADLDGFMTSKQFSKEWSQESGAFRAGHGWIEWWNPPIHSQDAWVTFVPAPRRTPRRFGQRLSVVDVIVAVRDANLAVVCISAAGN